MPARDLAAPYLIEVFETEDPFKPNETSSILKESPASRALSLLDTGSYDTLKKHLLRWLQTGDTAVLKAINRHLVAFGSDDILPAVTVLFESDDMFISSGARAGALEAIKANRAEAQFSKYVWEHSNDLLQSTKPPSMYDPIRLLVAIDREKTKQLLLEPATMRRDHPLLAEALKTLNTMKTPPEASFLNSLISDEAITPKHRREQIQQAAIYGLIIQKAPSADVHIEQILATPDEFSETMVLTAWTARFKLAGLTTLHDSAFTIYERANFELDTLSTDERGIILMHYLDAEVRNGGFEQWYYNDYGQYASETSNALKKVGARTHARIVNTANRLFGWGGPPSSREKIQQALKSMSEKKLQKMNELNEAWYDLPPWTLYAAAWDWKRQN
ncbi:DUF4375 domain-containing protein [Lentimonas sp. CC19]|uniref:DMP19 family protein n=1 Tax=Lentimonas sp. CC19 TaxID=2676097 RepID=UPI00138A21BD|nr:DUF4375 domain-containing protein [Lentimonas sp. CC19]